MDILRTIIHMGETKLTAPTGVDKTPGFTDIANRPCAKANHTMDINSVGAVL